MIDSAGPEVALEGFKWFLSPLVLNNQWLSPILALIFGITESLDTTPITGITVDRIQISAKKKPDIIKELDRIGINESTMFPEIEKAALYIKEKL